MSDVLHSTRWYSMNDMKEAQWFILIAGFMMVWMVMVMMV
jgi:hypothetical protein